MVETYDLVIKNARLIKREGLFEIAIRDGIIDYIGKHVHHKGEQEIDAEGGLVTEAFVNPHIHLCKAYTFPIIGDKALKSYQYGEMDNSLLAIKIASRVKEKYNEQFVRKNAEKAIREAVRHGVLYIRAFADTDAKAGLDAVKALIALRKKYKNIIKLQVVAFPQDGIIGSEGTEELLWKAAEIGADVIGGIPWIEYSREYMEEHINKVFEIAKTHNKDVAMLTDDTGDQTLETTEMLGLKTIKNKWYNRVTACHARALALKPRPYLERLAGLLRLAGVSLVSNPHTGPLHLPIKYMISQGVNVALGQDDISDAYYPFGSNNMLELAFLASHITWSMSLKDMELIYEMITHRAAKAINIKRYGLVKNARADLVVHAKGTRSIYELIWHHEKPVYVISNGSIIYRRGEEEYFDLGF